MRIPVTKQSSPPTNSAKRSGVLRTDEVTGHGDPDLGLHGVGAGSVVMLDAQVAFDPAEEQFDPPAQAVDFGYGQRRDLEMVGEKDKVAPGVGVEVTHFAQERRTGCPCFGPRGFADLVAAHSCGVTTGKERCLEKRRLSLARATKNAPAEAIRFSRLKSSTSPVESSLFGWK